MITIITGKPMGIMEQVMIVNRQINVNRLAMLFTKDTFIAQLWKDCVDVQVETNALGNGMSLLIMETRRKIEENTEKIQRP